MKSYDFSINNIELIEKIFPQVVFYENNVKKIDFEKLKIELSENLIQNSKEKYQLNWSGKNESIINANKSISKTLIPQKEKSIDFDDTKNIYIEGDNLEVLKILQESYLNKIKVIYIDPPYNTGNDFVYNDNFKKNENGELSESGQV